MKKLWTFLFLVIMFISFGNNLEAQYCTTGLYTTGCTDGDDINDFSFNTIIQTATGCGTSGYSDYTSLSTTLTLGTSYPLTLTNTYGGAYIKVWIDFNDDQTFDDVTEQLVLTSYGPTAAAALFSTSAAIPVTATPGIHRMRVRLVWNNSSFTGACSSYSYGEVHDYNVNITGVVPPMVIDSVTTQTASVENVGKNLVNQAIIRVRVSVSGAASPISLTQINFNTNGTTAPSTDISNAKVWYTGTSSTFATTTQFGTTVAAPNGTFNVSGTQVLSAGSQYFWLSYDIPGTAVNDNYVDAECTQITAGSTFTPTVTAPAGNRQIKNEVVIGSGVSTSDYQPMDRYYNYSVWEGIYLQSELGTAKDITSIGFDKASGADVAPIQNVAIYMKNSTDAVLPGGLIEDTTGFTLVYSGSFTNTATSGWMNVNLNNIFPYDGVSNLKIIIKKYYQAYTSSRAYYKYSTVSTNRSQYAYSDTQVPNGMTMTAWANLPNMKVQYQLPQPMAYMSSTANHPSTAPVITSSTNNVILGLQVVTQGALAPILSGTSFTFSTNGSTSPLTDILNAKLWYSGTSSNISTATQIGSTIASPNGSMVFNAGTGFPITFSSGTSYFWLTYDISPTATLFNAVDAECNSIIISGITYIPSIIAPAGNRIVKSALNGVYTINNLSPSSGMNYNNFTDAVTDLNVLGTSGPVTFNVTAGQVFPMTLAASPNNYAIAIATTGTPTKPIKFIKSGVGANPRIDVTGTSATNDIGVFIYGADYVKFDGIDVNGMGSSSTDWVEYGYYLQGPANNGCQYDTIMNCLVDLSKANVNSRGIYANVNAPTSVDGANSYNKFINNTIQDAYNGYYIYGSSAFHDKNNQIIGGTVTNLGNSVSTALYGIYMYYQDTAVVKNITISNITNAAGTLYSTYLYYCYGLEFSDNLITGINNTTSGTYGIYPYYGGDYRIFNNTVSNFITTTGAMYAIYPYYVTGFNAYNNTIRDFTGSSTATIYGIYPYYNYASTVGIYNNTIRDLATGGTIYGMNLYYASGIITMNVYNNKIYGLRTTAAAASYSIYGIYSTLSTSYATTANIYNNLIYNLRAEGSTSANAANGLYLSAGTNINVYHNTVYLNYVSANASNGSAAVYASTTPTTIDMRNNIFINKVDVATLGTRAAAFQRSSTGFTNLAATTNNNLYYAGAVPSSKNLILWDGTNKDSTLTQYKTRISSKDQTSKTEDVPFVSNIDPYDFNISTSIATQAESGGVVVAMVTSGLGGNARYPNAGYPNNVNYPATAPDLGCYEFAGIPRDLTAPAISYTDLTSSTSLTSRIFTASITDQGSVNVTTFKPRVYYKKTTGVDTYNDNTNATTGWKYVETTSTSSPFSFTLDYSKLYSAPVTGDTLQYFIIAQDNEAIPNVGALAAAFTVAPTNVALTAANFPLTSSPKMFRFSSAINGTILVGTGNPFNCLTGAGDTSVFKYINNNVLTGNLELVITSNLTETGFTALNQFAEEGAGNYTVTIRPQAAIEDTIRGSYSGALIRLNGADRVIFDGRYSGNGNYLTLNNSATSGSVFGLISLGNNLGATDNVIRNCNIYMGGNASGTYGISIGGATNASTGAHNNNNSIIANKIAKIYVGIWAQGIASTGVMSNLNISDNIIGHDSVASYLGHDGIFVANTTGSTISGNRIFNIVNTNTTSRGITLSTNTFNTNVTKNIIDNLKYTGTSGYGSHGLYINTGSATSNINVINNVISRISGDGWNSFTGSSPVGILLDGTTGGVNLYYNTVNMNDVTTRTSQVFTAALGLNTTTITNLNVKNNIFSNSYRSSGNMTSLSYAVYSVSPVSAFTSINNNLYSLNDTSIQGRVAGIGATIGALNYSTLADWQAASLQDANSKAGNPQFTGDIDLKPLLTSPALSSGTPIAGVTTDITGKVRSNFTPTIGAYEVDALKTLNLTLFLEGLYNGAGGMNEAQDDMGTHWTAGVADKITVELHNSIVPSIADYTITNLDLLTNGNCTVTVPSNMNDSYYIVVKHRNSIATWSSFPISFTGTSISYNFSTGAAQAYGDNMKDKNGVYVFYVGDVNQDEVVDLSDLVDMDVDLTNGTVAYVVYDLNGDGVVDLSDLVAIDENLTNGVVSMYP